VILKIGIEVFTNSSFFTNIGTFISTKVTDVRENRRGNQKRQSSYTGSIGYTRHRTKTNKTHKNTTLET
jgi:hypothetical protein